MHRYSGWLLREYLSPDEGAGGGAGGGQDPPPGGQAPPAETPPEEKTYTAAEVAALRKEAAGYRTKAKDLEGRLQTLEDASKSETQRLQEKAEKADALLAERDALAAEREAMAASLAEVVESQKKALGELDKDLLALLPEGKPTEQLGWLTRAVETARKRKPANSLPPGGGRNPGAGNGKTEPTEQERQQAAAHYAGRF